MVTLKVRQVGNSLGVTLPKEVVDKLRIHADDALYLTESPDGYRLSVHDPEFVKQMEIAERGMEQYKDALKALADA